jgi:serine phosphatase RsbU (regulator of sigma subunit)
MQDSMSNLSIKEATIQKQFQYQYEKKLITDSIQNSEKEKIVKAEITLKDEQIKRQTTEQYALFGGVFILIVFGGITFKRYKKSQLQKNIIAQQKQLVEAKSKEITDSINYAKRIQDSILPPISELKKQLRNSFVYYQPKDIVAGDFYWLESVDDTMLFAAADCTGHGVPGAMVSVVCNGALNRAVGEYKLSKPCEILDKARDLVVETFERSGDETSLRDGMDISLCSLQLSKNSATLQWAGANNPIYIIRPTVIASATAYREIGTSCSDLSGKQSVENEQATFESKITRYDEKYELIEIKPNKQPIGKHFRQDSFTNHTINLQKGDTIYIFTDGYADQFGGEKGKKLMYKPFKELLLSMQEKTMEEQKIVLEQFFENWKGSLEQVDDVCVIGVRI